MLKKIKISKSKHLPEILVFVLLFAVIGGYVIMRSFAATPTTYYVSKSGSNAGGTSWSTAWNELSQINWSIIQPGDTIILDGGSSQCASNYDFANHSTARPGLSCGMMYTTQLNIQKSGTSTLPITVRLSSESGHNGTAVVFGGRTSALPYCGQNYTQSGTARADGIVFNTRATGASFVTIDGIHRSGIMVYGAQAGVDFISDKSSNNTLRNMEIFDNGIVVNAPSATGGKASDYPGVFLDGDNNTIDRSLIHDNGQDEIQDNYTGAGPGGQHEDINNFTISSSWLYNHRDHPTWTGFPFNSGAEAWSGNNGSQDCTHVDGLQIYGGGTSQQNLTVKDSIFGPLLAQDIYPSDSSTSFDNVNISNVLHINPMLHPIDAGQIGSSQTSSTPANWIINKNTSYLTPGVNTGVESHGTGIWGTGHSLTNSIFNGGYFAYSPSFSGTKNGNIYYGGDAVPGGTNTNPLFRTPPAGGNSPSYAQLVAADYTPTCSTCAGKGSDIHTVQDLLNSIDSQNGSSSTSPSSLTGDLNNDNTVNIFDLSILLSNYGKTSSIGDLNSDSVVNIFDLSILLSNYGKTGGATSTTCALTTQHVPDGPDGLGGCWPGPTNTGPNAPESSMSTYTGSCTISTPNVTIDSKVINCSPVHVLAGADNLTIKNSYIKGGVVQDAQSPSDPSFTIQDSLIDNAVHYNACTSPSTCAAGMYACGDPNNATTDCGVGYHNFTIMRTEIVNSNRAAYCQGHCTIQDSYFHGTNLWPDHTNLAHASSVRNEQYLTLTHNAIGCDFTAPGGLDPATINSELGCSADMSGYPDFAPIMHATIDKNLFLSNNVGAEFCAYGGGTLGKPFSSDATNATYIVFTNNIFQAGANGKCGHSGAITDFIVGRTGNIWTNNKFDNGAMVSPN